MEIETKQMGEVWIAACKIDDDVHSAIGKSEKDVIENLNFQAEIKKKALFYKRFEDSHIIK